MNAYCVLPIGFEQLTPTTASDHKEATVPNKTSLVMITVETTNARVMISAAGTTADSTHGHVLQKDAAPVLIPVSSGAQISVASMASANSVVSITYFQ